MTQIKYLLDKGYGLEIPELTNESYEIENFAEEFGLEAKDIDISVNATTGHLMIRIPDEHTIESLTSALARFKKYNGKMIHFAQSVRISIEGEYTSIPMDELGKLDTEDLEEMVEKFKEFYGRYGNHSTRYYAIKNTKTNASKIIWWRKLDPKQQNFILKYEETIASVSAETFEKALDGLGIKVSANQMFCIRKLYAGAIIEEYGSYYKSFDMFIPKRKSYGTHVWDNIEIHHQTAKSLIKKKLLELRKPFDGRRQENKAWMLTKIMTNAIKASIKVVQAEEAKKAKESEQTDS